MNALEQVGALALACLMGAAAWELIRRSED